jgi:hypothetical protein
MALEWWENSDQLIVDKAISHGNDVVTRGDFISLIRFIFTLILKAQLFS